MAPRSIATGFTLLELLVVLSIVALTAGLMLPSASRWIDATRERGWREDLRAAVVALPIRAFRQGTPLVLDAAAVRQLAPNLPAAVEIRLSAPLRYSADGVADGANLVLRSGTGSREETWAILPLTGAVKP